MNTVYELHYSNRTFGIVIKIVSYEEECDISYGETYYQETLGF